MRNRRGAEGTEKDEGVEIYISSQRSLAPLRLNHFYVLNIVL